MTIYNVHIYREMRLVFRGIEAANHHEAAALARDKPTDEADSIDDCDGETFAALVDVQGDENYEQSTTIEFEPALHQRAVSRLLDALKIAEGFVQWALDHGADARATGAALGVIREAISDAEAACTDSQALAQREAAS